MFRDNFGLILTTESHVAANRAHNMHNMFYAKVLGKDKLKQGVTQFSSFFGVLFKYAREHDFAVKFMKAHISGVAKANPLKTKKVSQRR